MTTALPLTTPTTSPALRDHRPSDALRAMALVAGGVLFAVGNALHPLTHDDAATQAATWELAHVLFGIGALLIAASLGVLLRRFRGSRLGVVGLGVLWLGMVLIPAGAVVEAWVRPLFDHSAFHAIEEAMLPFTMVAGFSNLIGPALVAVAAVRHRLLPLWAALAIPGITAGALLVPAMPAEGWSIIPGTVLFGLGMAAAGWVSRPSA
ncbi:hypothetical protein E9529_06705 [Blastococcus sp. KM273128]|uniref:hypothetical protein n=1 Tax=Blastococcus sp. KM273128 TaxID=2570314 RepID=UPI001F3E1C00|nr:hypothetical protein [Blastococcus sp. KM273128]MCF6743967.1 hypothetical protein [Blastococcus sp. KM273128]